MPKKQKQKYYVVWQGACPGVYETWEECRLQVHGYTGAIYKSFPTQAQALEAYMAAPERNAAKPNRKTTASPKAVPLPDGTMPFEVNSLAVDAACSGNPGVMEYRGVDIKTGQQLFHFKATLGTNNIGEFLAIVHGLAMCKQKEWDMPIYSDSRNAILWVAKKQCKTRLARTPKTEELFTVIKRAEDWLQQHSYSNAILKWNTREWGEIPADFGRK